MKQLCLTILVIYLVPAVLAAEIPGDSQKFEQARHRMVADQIQRRGIANPDVLAAMSKTYRHLFVPEGIQSRAYSDRPLPIGEGQTISQPYIVALMTESLNITRDSRVLEIGTGSGYQAAVLAKIVKQVYTIEIKEKLFKKASQLLQTLGYDNIETLLGDGYFGWEEKAPFDGIMITAAVDHIPPPLLKQLKNGGRLILPLGNPFAYQNLVLVTKQDGDYTVEQITGVLFVPLTGHALESR
ncbi:MAG: protein-L-isoaspartate(D-aspartate) O-methyltransferase [Desulfobacterales bacterium]|jgi:protein-L-isoaspartate(D-aspartate) O-methyltransferase